MLNFPRRAVIPALLLVLLLGLFARLSVIRWGLPNDEHFFPYYPDEYTVLMVLQGMKPAQLDFYPRFLSAGGKLYPDPVFYFYLVGAAEAAASKAGLAVLTPDKAHYLHHPGDYARLYLIGRLVTLLFGLLSIGLVFLCGAELFGAGWGLLAALFLAVTPLHIVYSSLMNVAVPASFFVLLVFYLCLKVLSSGAAKYYLLAGLAAGLGIGTKMTAAPTLGMIAAAALLGARKEGRLRLVLASFAAAGLAFFATNPYYLSEAKAVLSWLAVRAQMASNTGAASAGTRYGFFYPLTDSIPAAIGWLPWLLGLAGIAAALFRRRGPELLLLAWVFPYYFITAWSGVPVIRYQVEQAAFFALCAALFLYWARLRFPGGRLAGGAVALAAAASFGSSLVYAAALISGLRGEDPRSQASRWIKENIPASAAIAVVKDPLESFPDIVNMAFYASTRYKDGPPVTPAYKIRSLNCVPPAGRPAAAFLVLDERWEYLCPAQTLPALRAWIEGNYSPLKTFRVARRLPWTDVADKPYPRFILNTPPITVLGLKGTMAARGAL